MNSETVEVREVSPRYGFTAEKPAVPVGYKQTEVGIIPEDWDCKILGDLGQVVRGGSPRPAGSPKYFNGSYIPWLTVASLTNIPKSQQVVRSTLSMLTELGSKHSRILNEQTLIISNSGATLGVAKILGIRCCANDGIAAIINQNYGNRSFLAHFINTRTKDLHDKVATGNGQPNLNTTSIKTIAVPFPSEKEQRAIATALSDVDALLEELDRLIAKKRDIKQATMQQLLTGQIRLPGFEGEWKLLNIANNSTLKARIGWQGLTTKEYLNSGHYGLITGTDFNGGKIVWEGCHFVEKDRYDQDVNIQLKNNDVLITKDGTIGKAAYIENLPFPATLNSGVFIIRPLNDSYEPKYFYYVLMSRFFTEFLNKLAAGSTISHLYQKDFLGFEFPAPPSRKEQLAIATILSDIDAEIEELVKRRAKTATLKKAMMQELLTGRTRLVNYCI
ncbi:MAG: restriction endonuclease subunit S [Halomonas sp.]|nr:restriction endonuclease subunit S [Halomonas sp.]MDM7480446.1 restriction endonuclease subunit S [Halomonas sp.]